MWDNVIGHHIGRCNRNLLLINIGILAGLFLLGALSERYLYNCLVGPFPLDHNALTQIANPAGLRRYFVFIDQLKPLETGLQYVETTTDKTTKEVKSRTVTATYFAAPVGDQFLLIKSPSSKPFPSYEGSLVTVPIEVRMYFQKELDRSNKRQFGDVFLPYLLDGESFREPVYWSLLFAIPLGGLAAFNIYKAIGRFKNVERSPIFKSLQRFDQNPANVALIIDQDLRGGGDLSTVRSVRLTSSWFMHKTFFGLEVLHLSEIIWVYQKLTSHSINFIPTGKSYQVVVGDKYGRRIEADTGRWKEKDATASLVQIIADKIPWVVSGYSDQLNNAFNKNLAGFLAAVDERHKTWSNRSKS